MTTNLTRDELISYAKGVALARGAEKFTDDDVVPENYKLTDGAILWMRAYEGGMSFVHDMKRQDRTRGLTRGQLRGVLNCLRADVQKSESAKQPAVTLELAGIVQLIDKAREHLKFPKIRLATSCGQTIVISVAGAKSRLPGAVNVTTDGSFYDREYLARINTDGTLDRRAACGQDVVALLERFAADPAAIAAEFGRLMGYCSFCNTRLDDERSTSVGYGPVCAKNYGLPYPTKKEVRESAVA